MTTTAEESRAFLLQKQSEEHLRNLALWKNAHADAEKIIHWIASHYHYNKIYQWGSVLHKEAFRDYSDIDIAIEGLQTPGDIFQIIDYAVNMTTFPVDIVELDKINPSLQISSKTKP